MDAATRRLRSAGVLLLACALLGTVGYQLIERWNPFDALYMTIITIATVGYGETHPLSPAGRLFTIGLILAGVGVLTYGVTAVTTFVMEGTLTNLIGRRKMDAAINTLREHIVVCGAGETGRHIAEEFMKTQQPFVMIDQDGERLKAVERICHALTLQGNATEDDVLLQARIKEAKGLVTALPEDRDNVFVVLTARALNPRLRIIARAVEVETRAKLIKAGADATVSSNFIGAMRMASEMVRPTVVSFLDTMLRTDGGGIRVEEVTLPRSSNLVGRRLSEAGLYEQTGLVPIAIRKGERVEFNPSPQSPLREGDGLIVCCSSEQLTRLRALLTA